MSRITSCGPTWNTETSIEATGNISRGIAIFCTSALLRTIERVPALKVSLKKWTMISPQKMWIAKFSTPLSQPEDHADHEVVDEELRQRVDVGPEQPEERALVARADLAAHQQPQQVAAPEDLEQPARGRRRGSGDVAARRASPAPSGGAVSHRLTRRRLRSTGGRSPPTPPAR